MFNFDCIKKEDIIEHNPNWPEIPDHWSGGTSKNHQTQDLSLQVQKFWNVKATVIPVVVGALGTTNE